jgi:hypothetical protein
MKELQKKKKEVLTRMYIRQIRVNWCVFINQCSTFFGASSKSLEWNLRGKRNAEMPAFSALQGECDCYADAEGSRGILVGSLSCNLPVGN